MKSLSTLHLIALFMAFSVCWSAMHCYTGKFGKVVGEYGIFVVCSVDLLLGFLIETPHRFLLQAAIVIFVPLLFALSFSRAECALESRTVSKGWATFTFIAFYLFGLIAFVIGLIGRWLAFNSLHVWQR
jgi:hypothetical protein